MEQLKKLRSPLRASFTKAVNALEEYLKKEASESFKETLQASLDGIERRAEQISGSDKSIMEMLMADKDTTEEELAVECEGISSYEDKLFLCKRKVEKELNMLADREKASSEYDSANSLVMKTNKKYRLLGAIPKDSQG